MTRARTLLSAWATTVRRDPNKTVLIEGNSGRGWTLLEIDARAADWCAAHGAHLAGQAVAFAEPNGVGWLTRFVGLLKAGAVIVALDPSEPEPVQRALASAIGAPFLWIGNRLEQRAPLPRARRDGRRLIKLTSGSTGAPRALLFTDAQILADGRNVCATMFITRDDVNYGAIPFGHSYGLGNLIVPLVTQGTAVVSGSSFLPHAVATEIERHGATVFPAVPALIRALVESTVASAQLRSLRTIISAGAPLSADVARRFFGRFEQKIHAFYGSSETGGISYDRTGDAALQGGVGSPLQGVRVRFKSSGRFEVSSAAVSAIGHSRRWKTHGVWYPADRAVQGPDGEITLTGRTGTFVKIAGRRLNLTEIERILRTLPGVQEALAWIEKSESGRLVAAVAGDVNAADIKNQLRDRVAPWKIPRRFVVLSEFPLTARGKPDVRQLRGG